MSTKIKALTLWQPWATLIAIGAKNYETRSWSTNHRGPLAIHAAKRWKRDQVELCYEKPFRTALKATGYEKAGELPRGKIVCTVELNEVLPSKQVRTEVGPWDRAFGNWSDGRYGWRMLLIDRLDEPIACRGHQGLWNVPESVTEKLKIHA